MLTQMGKCLKSSRAMEVAEMGEDLVNAITAVGLSILRHSVDTRASARKSSVKSVECSTQLISVWWMDNKLV